MKARRNHLIKFLLDFASASGKIRGSQISGASSRARAIWKYIFKSPLGSFRAAIASFEEVRLLIAATVSAYVRFSRAGGSGLLKCTTISRAGFAVAGGAGLRGVGIVASIAVYDFAGVLPARASIFFSRRSRAFVFGRRSVGSSASRRFQLGLEPGPQGWQAHFQNTGGFE